MKKLLVSLLVMMMFMLGACSNADDAINEMPLEDIMDSLYADFSEEELPMFGEYVEVNADNVNWYLGLNECDFKEALANEPLIGSIAHSAVLVRGNEGQDMEALKEEIRANLNTNKWICVGIDSEDLVTEIRGNVLLVIIDAEGRAQKMVEVFKSL